MHERGAIRNRQLAMQIRDFRGLRFGSITPTDIDGFLEFGDRLFVFIEGKRDGAPLANGQMLALARLADACHCPPRRFATVIVVDHPTSDDDIDYAIATVRIWRWGGEWRKPLQQGIKLREAIDRLLAMSQRTKLKVVK